MMVATLQIWQITFQGKACLALGQFRHFRGIFGDIVSCATDTYWGSNVSGFALQNDLNLLIAVTLCDKIKDSGFAFSFANRNAIFLAFIITDNKIYQVFDKKFMCFQLWLG